ncbi:MAG: NHL repeat-containing protein, partial [candidate division KSB1 bacterium]|nr:NHL repeat-containing protein [candidate division KSB1 bacterium]
ALAGKEYCMGKIVWLCLFFYPALTAAQGEPKVIYRGIILSGGVGSKPLLQPLGLDVDPRGNLYLADTGHHRVLKCNPAGELLREVGGFGFHKEQFDRPVDVWAGNGLEVFIADYNNQRVERYDKDLNYLSSFYSDELMALSLQFGYPAAVRLSTQGELFVADHEFNRILRFDTFGVPKSSFGDYNWGEGQLARPAKMLITGRREIFVSDSTADAIVEFDAYGNFVRRFGKGILRDPGGIALWPRLQNRHDVAAIVVADRGNHRLVVFNREGEVLLTRGTRGPLPEQFDSPTAVATHGNRIFVLDTGNHRVQVFEVQQAVE